MSFDGKLIVSNYNDMALSILLCITSFIYWVVNVRRVGNRQLNFFSQTQFGSL